MAESNGVADVLAVPLIAYRGMWDKFARPSSLGALRRSYARGVPSLVRVADRSEIAAVTELVSDPAVNRRGQAVYFIISERPPTPIASNPVAPSIFLIDESGPSDRTWPIYQECDASWMSVGCYVPVGAARRGLTIEDVGGADRNSSVILFESVNVVDDTCLSLWLDGLNDADVYASIRALAGPAAQISRVSDLIEFDLLHRQVLEAA